MTHIEEITWDNGFPETVGQYKGTPRFIVSFCGGYWCLSDLLSPGIHKWGTRIECMGAALLEGDREEVCRADAWLPIPR